MSTVKSMIAQSLDSRVAETLSRMESHIDYRAVKTASWGFAGAAVFTCVAAGMGAIAATAGAYAAVRIARNVTNDAKEAREDRTLRAAERLTGGARFAAPAAGSLAAPSQPAFSPSAEPSSE